MIIEVFSRAIQQLPDAKFRSVLIRGLILTILLYVGLYFVVDYFIGQIENSWFDWLDSLLQAAGWVGFAIAAFVLFPALASFFMAFFLDDVAAAVEVKHYPTDPPGQGAPVATSLGISARFTAALIGLNILLLLVIWLPPLYFVLFYGVTGYLLSREYFELVGQRHMAPADIRKARKGAGGRLMLVGIVIAFLLTIPVVNFLAPLIATAAMVHVYKSMPGSAAA